MKRAVIVGATSGIGRQLARVLAGHKYFVGAAGRREDLLNELKAEYPGQISIAALDVTDLPTVATKLEALIQEIGGLDLLIFSSGTGHLNPALDFAPEKETIDVNVLGFTQVMDWAFRFFETQGTGHLVGITSIAGLRGGRHAPAYHASKAYQISYLEGLRQKARQQKLPIVITDIRPGFVATAMAKGDKMFWVAPADKAARQIYQAVESKARIAYITRRWSLIAHLLRWLPGMVYERM